MIGKQKRYYSKVKLLTREKKPHTGIKPKRDETT